MPKQAFARPQPTLALGLLGGALLASGGRRDPARRVLTAAGIGVIACAVQPFVRGWLVRLGTTRRSIRLTTTLDIKRPVAEVFSFCKDFENFPRIFGALRSVIDYQDGRSHWEAFSPSGRVVVWDAVVTKYLPNSVIAWESVPQSEVQTTGVVRFTAVDAATTRLTIEVKYVPGQSGLGDALHALVSQRREDQIRSDLQRAAFYIESLPSAAGVEPDDAPEPEPSAAS